MVVIPSPVSLTPQVPVVAVDPPGPVPPATVSPSQHPVPAATAVGEPTPAHPPAVAGPGAGPALAGTSAEQIEWRGLAVDTATRIATVGGSAVELTRSEFDLLAALLASGRRVRSKADLVLMLRGESYVTTYYVNDADKRAIEVHMANLRRKIGDSTSTPRWIETVRGVGYRMVG